MGTDGLIYDWNTAGDFRFPSGGKVTLDDETLRDGLQNPSVHNPSIEEKIEILHLMESLGIEMANIGLPAAGPRAYADAEALAKEIAGARMKIRPNCAARTHENDIRPVAEISQRAGIPIEVGMFLGSSPIRRQVEDWTVDYLLKTTEAAVKFGVSQGLPVMYVTEHTIRTDADTVRALYSTAIRCGARSIVLCDTVGHATPMGAYNLVKFVRESVVIPSGETIRVDWHGHCDRGLAIANSFAAIAAGANQIQCAANSLGEGGQHADGTYARQHAVAGLDRPRSLEADGILREGSASDSYDDSAELSRGREGRLPYGHRRPRRGSNQSLPQG